jgi:hypothetical protein
MLKTKRLWPHYLWTGYILILLGTIASVSRSEVKRIKTVQWTFLSIFLGVSIYYFLVRELPLFLNLSKRNEISTAHQWSQQAISYVKKKYPSSRVGTDGSVLYPFEDFVGVDLYHPFAGKLKDRATTRFYWYTDFPEKIWDDDNQVLIFYRRHPKRMYVMHPNVYLGRHDELYQLYLKNVGVNYELDTSFGSFGEVMVYKQIKK